MRDSLSEDTAAGAVRDLLCNLALFRPELAATFLSEIQAAEDRARLLSVVRMGWAGTAPEDLFRWAQGELVGDELLQTAQMALEALAEAGDPGRAAQLGEDLPFSESRLHTLGRIARSWARADVQGAYEWIDGLTDDTERTYVFGAIASALARHDPDLARTLLDSEESAGVRRALAEALAGEMSESDSALDFVRSLPSEFQGAASETIAQRLSQIDPERALNYLEGADDAEMEIAGLRWALTELIQRDPAEAAARLAEFDSQEGVKTEMAPWLATMWYRVDSEGASRWVSELPEGEMRDRAIESLVSRLQLDDEELARAWANDISDETRRQAVLESLSYDRVLPRIE
ncbi:MAG TPA: hypothetical protein VMN36_02390 [Verrucomicrobiales bacterium]|nr:hypothetical protein [Verrucomicrobiales bacterium]